MSIPRFSGTLDGREVVAVLASDYDLAIRQRDDIANLYAEVYEERCDALAVLRAHGLHVDGTWCWCNPDVTDYSTDREDVAL